MQNWQILESAADYMEKHGNTKHALEDGKGRVCLVGAIGKFTTIPTLDKTLMADLYTALPFIYKNKPMTYNDVPWRRGQSVIMVLRKAAANSKKKYLEEHYNEALARIEKLEKEKAACEARIFKLERENNSLKERIRVLVSASFKKDVEFNLSQIDKELDDLYNLISN